MPVLKKSLKALFKFLASTRKLILFMFVIIFFFITTCSTNKTKILLVKNGKAISNLILPSIPSDEEKQASLELQKYVEKCSGAKLNIISENEIDNGQNLYKNQIYIGICNKTKEVININTFQPEELVILNNEQNLFITGKNGGTLYGVYYCLNQYLGIDWVLPGELGEVIPHSNTISLNIINYRYQSPVKFRNLRSIPWGNERSIIPIQKILQLAGIESIDDSLKAVEDHFRSLPEPPFKKWGAGGRISLKFGHSFNDYWEKYGKDHPDFFALQANGSRIQNPERERLCVSNPKLWDFVAERKIEEFENNPQQDMASICPNDGGPNQICMCKICQSWDPDNAPKIRIRRLIDPYTGKSFEEYPSLSDRYFRFYNEVAKRVAKVYPDKKLGVYAYSIYKTVPVNIDEIHPNLVVELVSMDKELIDGWSKMTRSGQLYLRPNSMWPQDDGDGTLGFVRNSARWHAETIRYAVEKGFEGFDFDGGIWNWGTQGLEYYVLIHAMWDPYADIDQLINDYHFAAFGAGAPSMLKYHQKIENFSNFLREETRYTGLKENPQILAEYYSEEFLSELQEYIDKAKSALKDKSSKEYLRIMIVEEGLTYTRLGSKLLRIAGSTTNYSDPVYLAAEKEFHNYLASNLRSFGVNAGRTYFYYGMALSAAKRKH